MLRHSQVCVAQFKSLLCLAWALGVVIPASITAAQDAPYAVEGYITSLHPPTGFEVNGQHVILQPQTTYGLQSDRNAESESTVRNSLQVGAYVFVTGSLNRHPTTVIATTVLLRDDFDRKLSGLGVITEVVSSGPEPVFRADGYTIRITSATGLSFRPGVKSLVDVGPNDWVRYEGMRGKDGVLVATSALFLPPKSSGNKARHGAERPDLNLNAPNPQSAPDAAAPPSPGDGAGKTANQTKNGNGRVATLPGWHKVADDAALQARVQRIGMRLVPEYQKQLSPSDPSKIDFQFYAVNEPSIRSEICSENGLIMIPLQLVSRLKSDDQVAAILADGVAFNLQRQEATMSKDKRILAGLFIGFGGAGLLAGSIADNKREGVLEKQRGRVALALLSDARYDPWQSPEAWRLAAPKHLPKNTGLLHYPNLSLYQLEILNLQYKQLAVPSDSHSDANTEQNR